MKYNWRWICGNSFMIAISIFCIIGLFIIPSSEIAIKGLLFITLSFILIVCSLCVTFDFINGEIYYKKIMLSKDKFDIKKYDNMLHLAYNNHCWVYSYQIDEIANLEKIKTIGYFNLKKELISWHPIPYEQLNEKKNT